MWEWDKGATHQERTAWGIFKSWAQGLVTYLTCSEERIETILSNQILTWATGRMLYHSLRLKTQQEKVHACWEWWGRGWWDLFWTHLILGTYKVFLNMCCQQLKTQSEVWKRGLAWRNEVGGDQLRDSYWKPWNWIR